MQDSIAVDDRLRAAARPLASELYRRMYPGIPAQRERIAQLADGLATEAAAIAERRLARERELAREIIEALRG